MSESEPLPAVTDEPGTEGGAELAGIDQTLVDPADTNELSRPLARRLHAARRPAGAAHRLADAAAPAWTLLAVPLHPASASAIRAARKGAVP